MRVVHIELVNEGVTYECRPTVEDVVIAIMQEYHRFDVPIGEILNSTHIHGLSVQDVMTVYARCYGLVDNTRSVRMTEDGLVELSETYSEGHQQLDGCTNIDTEINRKNTKEADKLYLVAVDDAHVRDNQVAKTKNASYGADADWVTVEHCEVILGKRRARNEQEAMVSIAEREGISVDILKTYEVK